MNSDAQPVLPNSINEEGDVFVARQPIFNRQQQVTGYELLFRSGKSDFFDFLDPNEATSKVITNSFLTIGMDVLTGGKLAYINFTRELLLDGSALLLPSDSTVIEILEDVPESDEIFQACRELKERGYKLAVDDLSYECRKSRILELADVVKVDFSLNSERERAELARQLAAPDRLLLAEKVETLEEFEEASSLGYQCYQGYFFSKPIIISGKKLPGSKVTYIRILQAIHQPELNFQEMEGIIKHDVSLSAKLLKYINAAVFPWSGRIESIQHALVLLGEAEVRRWVSLIALSGLGQGKPRELVLSSIIRGRFCELLGELVARSLNRLDLFLLGTFSMIDAILNLPLEDALNQVPLTPAVRNALKGDENEIRPFLEVTLCYERADWEQLSMLCHQLELPEEKLPMPYVQAVEWAQRIFAA